MGLCSRCDSAPCCCPPRVPTSNELTEDEKHMLGVAMTYGERLTSLATWLCWSMPKARRVAASLVRKGHLLKFELQDGGRKYYLYRRTGPED